MVRDVRLCALAYLMLTALAASEYRGQVTFGGLPVPGVTVTATERDQTSSAVTDLQGSYVFSDLPDGSWTLTLAMTGFATVKQEVTVGANELPGHWELKLLPLDQIDVQMRRPAVKPAASAPAPAASEPAQARETFDDELSQRAADGLLINGSVNNGAASAFAQLAAFGNSRINTKNLYNGGIGLIVESSAWDARPFSLTGQDTPKAAYSRFTGVLTLGGPLRIPRLFKNGPNFFAAYQWTRNNNASTQPALLPDAAERSGVFPSAVVDPLTGGPFPSNVIPPDRISTQARSLLKLYPLPDFQQNAGYNYQVPLVSPTHQDALQSRFNQTIDPRNQLYGRFAFQNTREDNPNVFGFRDTLDVLGINASANWSNRLSRRWFLNLGIQFSRLAARVTPYFENRENVSGAAGISGNNQDPRNWGPPALNFSSGIAGLADAQSSHDRSQTSGLSYSMLWNRGAHDLMFGTDLRRQEFNYLSQQDPRGTFTFTGAATGSDFADFLLGIPDTSSIAFGNADKYFRDSVYDAFLTDDWRIGPELTLNAGGRWEYGAPITEQYGRLVNLDIAPGFTAVAPVIANHPSGTLTGRTYPSSLVRPDRSGFEPRVGIAWRPVSGSSLVLRAGYGVYRDTSVYQNMALQMAQQPPLSKSFSVQNSPADPLTLADGFHASPSSTGNTFAIDPNFRVGYAQNWQLALQSELPGSLQITATYLGIKGTRGPQQFLPNTLPAGSVNPCPACPTGFAYLTSNGNSSREAAQMQLRRRLRSGFTGTLQYTFSKSIDDDAALGGQGTAAAMQNMFAPNSPNAGAAVSTVSIGTSTPGPAIAQNWLNLRAERGLSTFDQRHLLSLQMQYTTGMGLSGGTLLAGWKGAFFKEWTVATQITAGSGLPQTPIFLAPVEGTGFTGTIRPDYTGAPLYAAPSGFYLNRAAYIAPSPGQWGNAGRDSITGPAGLLVNTSLGRTFRLNDRFNLDLRADSVNLLNHVTFTAWNTIVNSTQFGLPSGANAMRSMQLTLRLRF